MQELWVANGFYLWALTTALVIISLAWLAWNTFAPQPEASGSADKGEAGGQDELEAPLATLVEAVPHMQATLGRTLQFFGMVRYADPAGAQSFTLAVSNARGDGFVISSSVRGGLSAKLLTTWAAPALTQEEQSAVDRARAQQELP